MGAAFTVLLVGTAQTEESYLCISDNVVGFTQGENGQWERQGFKPNKYIVKEIVEKPGEKSAAAFLGIPFVVTSFETSETIAYCMNGFKEGNMECGKLSLQHFRINKDSLRFTATETYQYFYTVEGRKNVFVEIGKCSPL